MGIKITSPSQQLTDQPILQLDNGSSDHPDDCTKSAVPCQPIPSNLITMRFPVRGDRVPLLHGYNLYSALIHANPQLKRIQWQLKPITGRYTRHWIELTSESHFAIRGPVAMLEWLQVPSPLRVERTFVEIGEMEGRSLSHCPNLYSPIVVIKQLLNPEETYSRDRFLVSLGKQLASLDVEGMPTVGTDKRYCQVHGRSVIGFPVSFEGLGELSSLRLQAFGLGGKQRMGCGGFW
jgi:CRISPR-associated protein Cas6